MPDVRKDGKAYTFQLRQGLHYSDGTPIKASDFKFAIKRAIKLNWTAKAFLTGFIQGAADFDAGKANDISGMTTDDSTGKIVVKLSHPFGGARARRHGAAAQDTPMKPQNTQGTIGDGPYKWDPIQAPGRPGVCGDSRPYRPMNDARCSTRSPLPMPSAASS